MKNPILVLTLYSIHRQLGTPWLKRLHWRGGKLISGLDPGTEETGWALYCPGEGISSGIEKNANMLTMIQRWEVVDPVRLAIEMFSSFGVPVGREVFETVWWIGRFTQAWHTPDAVRLVYRETSSCTCAEARGLKTRTFAWR